MRKSYPIEKGLPQRSTPGGVDYCLGLPYRKGATTTKQAGRGGLLCRSRWRKTTAPLEKKPVNYPMSTMITTCSNHFPEARMFLKCYKLYILYSTATFPKIGAKLVPRRNFGLIQPIGISQPLSRKQMCAIEAFLDTKP